MSVKLQKKKKTHGTHKAKSTSSRRNNKRKVSGNTASSKKSAESIPNSKVKSIKVKRQRREFIGILVTAFSILSGLSIYFRGLTGLVGEIILHVTTGMLGFVAFFVPPLLFIYGVILIFFPNRSQYKNKIALVLLLLLLIGAIFHAGTFNKADYENMSLFQCLKTFYKAGRRVADTPPAVNGGVIGGLISVPLCLILQKTGTIIVLGAFAIVLALMITEVSLKRIVASIAGQLKSLRASRDESYDKEDFVELDEPVFLKELDEPVNVFDNTERGPDRGKVIDFPLRNADEPSLVEQQPLTGERMPVNTVDERIPIHIKEVKTKKQGNNIENDFTVRDNRIRPMNGRDYQLPPFSCMEPPADGINTRKIKAAAIENVKKLEETLLSFGINAPVINVAIGPAFTRYELQPGPGIRVSRIVNLVDDIALSLATQGIRIEAPIPGKAAVGVEVPNKEVAPILLREVLETPEFVKYKSKLAVGLGKDISGENVVIDLAKMPHLLIAGATGSGKSVCINSIIISILYKATPDEVKMLMIDPKVVELGVYNGIPHLLIPVVTDPSKAAGALQWAVQEMVTRYKLFADVGVRDLKGYNRYIQEQGQEAKLPQIVIIIDELSDLMMVAPHDVEDSICRLAQMARAAGMHLVIATQRPSVNVITGVIKANIPSRIAFAVSSQVDSRTILDMAGAEKLLGKGDMLYYPVGMQKPIRVKGTFVSDKEVEQVVEFVKNQALVSYDEEIIDKISSINEDTPGKNMDADELLPQAIDLVIDCGQASVSLIQRRMKVGYARAGRIVDQMADRGIISGFEGSKPRRVLITREQWEEMKMNNID